MPQFIILPVDFCGNLENLNWEIKVLLRYGPWIGLNNTLKISLLFQLFGVYRDTFDTW